MATDSVERRPAGLAQSWRAGRSTLGASCKIASPLVAESVAAVGFDYVYIDQQHGVIDAPSLLAMIQAITLAGSIPVTRVQYNRPELIGHALDMGAKGIIVPLIETAEEAAAAVAACRYPVAGVRSYGAIRPGAPNPAEADGDPAVRAACIVLVESQLGIDNLDAIAATPGVDAIMIGPQDLALSLGVALRGDWEQAPVLRDAMAAIRDACARHGIASGIGTTTGAKAKALLDEGFLMVNLGNDLAHMKTALAQHHASALPAEA